MSDYSQLSDYSFTEWLVKNKAVNAPTTFEDIIMIMIKTILRLVGSKCPYCEYDTLSLPVRLKFVGHSVCWLLFEKEEDKV